MSTKAIKDALAAGPTEGPWGVVRRSLGSSVLVVHGDGVEIVKTVNSMKFRDGEPEANAAFIAAVNPTAIRALLAELEEAKRALETIAAFNPEDHDETSDEWGEAWAFGQCREIAAAAIGKEQSK